MAPPPGAATYLMEPFLDTEGRRNYKAELISAYKGIATLEGECNDRGRITRIKRGISETLVDINNIAMCKGEKAVWTDRPAG